MNIQIIPDKNLTNTKVLGLVENLHFYKTAKERFVYHSTKDYIKIGIKEQDSINYIIYMTKENVSFYLSFPDEYKDNIITELNICWGGATFKETKLPEICGETRELELLEHFFLSLNCDLRGEFPLSNILETQNILKENESIVITLILTPVSPSWKREQEDCVKHFEQGKMPSKTLFAKENIPLILANAFCDIIYTAVDFINDLITDDKIEHERINDLYYQMLRRNGLSNETKEKSRYNAFKTKIKITINSERKEMLFVNMLKAFNSMAGDNKFIMKKQSKYSNILSSKEIAQIMQLPTKYYQETYRINSIENREVDIPKELLTGGIPIGIAIYKTNKIETKFPNKPVTPRIIIGAQNAGKTEYLKNYIYYAQKQGDSIIFFDYISKCETSNSLIKYCNKVNVIDLSNLNNLPAFAYPEIGNVESAEPVERLRIANAVSRQIEYLINSLSGELLSPRMTRYLDSASKVVFINNNARVMDVVNVLLNWQIRNEFIRKAKYSGCFDDCDNEIVDLESLNERDETGKIIGTRESKIEGIIDRITTLQKDIYLRQMLKNPINYSQDFRKWMDEGFVTFLQIPEFIYSNKQIKDTIVTYFLSRIWLGALMRKGNRTVHVIIDEVHQIPVASKLIAEFITETRKYGICFVFTLHYLKQFRMLLDAVKSAGTSYMLLAGTEKENIMALEQEIQPFTVQEIMRLKPYHSLNIINIGNQYAVYVSKLPPILA